MRETIQNLWFLLADGAPRRRQQGLELLRALDIDMQHALENALFGGDPLWFEALGFGAAIGVEEWQAWLNSSALLHQDVLLESTLHFGLYGGPPQRARRWIRLYPDQIAISTQIVGTEPPERVGPYLDVQQPVFFDEEHQNVGFWWQDGARIRMHQVSTAATLLFQGAIAPEQTLLLDCLSMTNGYRFSGRFTLFPQDSPRR